MKYETSVVYLEQVPKVVIDSGFDWPTFFSFMATIAVFAIGTWLTIRSSNKNYQQQERIFGETLLAQEKSLRLTHEKQNASIRMSHESQEKISRANAVKISRQAWIDQLREACSNYLALLLIMNGHIKEKDGKVEFGAALQNFDEAAIGAEIVVSWMATRSELRLKIFELKYRIELLANPKEDLFKDLLALVNKGVYFCEEADGKDLVLLCEKMKVISQEILKIEWDRTKNMV